MIDRSRCVIDRSIVSATSDVTEPAKIHIRVMRISCAKSVGCGCGFVARSKFDSYCDSTKLLLSASLMTKKVPHNTTPFCVHFN